MSEIKTVKEKKNFDFVDTIRCISMIGIVWEHGSAVPPNIYHNVFDTIVEASVIQSFKFSTIAFFLIGGFLINHKFQEYSTIQYLKNRFNNTVKPWLFWAILLILLTCLDRYVAYRKGGSSEIVDNFFGYVGHLSFRSFFFTSFWFIPNFLFCITILLLFKKYLYKIWFGVILAIMSLFYSVNLYYGWVETLHAAALFGFIFYLWLGVYLNKYFTPVMAWIEKKSYAALITVVILTFCLACLESMNLNRIGISDSYNTLRVTNILYSFAMFALLLKIGNIQFLKDKLKPRETTFGIYLLHFVVIDRVFKLILQPLHIDVKKFGIWENTANHLVRFLVAYSLSLLITMLINKTRFKWVVGNRN